jgi:hypothetical protein
MPGTPRGALHRIARLPDPLAWPPWEVVGGGRFDDPRREFRVLYAAAQRRGAFVETLAQFRPALHALARLQGDSRQRGWASSHGALVGRLLVGGHAGGAC